LIASFGDAATAAVYDGARGAIVRRIPPTILSVARRKLDMIASARRLLDLASPPGNRLERLRHDLAGWHSIRINEQWRIVFRWENGDAHGVRIVDHHA
jgi:proteic killer suppression protein